MWSRTWSNNATRSATAWMILVGAVLMLGLGSPLTAATITVGPDGDWPSLQHALAATGSPPNDEIRIQAGVTLQETLLIDLGVGALLEISGGWDATFTSFTHLPTLTVIDGGGSRVFDVNIGTGSTFYLYNLTIRNGGATGQGAGLRINAESSGDIGIYNNIFRSNTVTAQSNGHAYGSALYIVSFTSTIEVNDNQFLDNSLALPDPLPTTVIAAGGAVCAYASLGSDLQLQGNLIQGSSCTGLYDRGTISGCGLFLGITGTSELDLKENTITDSTVSGFATINGVAGHLFSASSVPAVVERNRWQGAQIIDSNAAYGALLHVALKNGSQLTQRSSLIADSSESGLMLDLYDNTASPTWQGVNLTVAGHPGWGIVVVDEPGSAWLSNSISTGNGTDLYLSGESTVVQDHNLVGSDPGFAYPAGGCYQLQAGAAALEAGTAAPPGGLSATDLKDRARVQGSAVDIGAYEGVGLLLQDGFESGSTGGWS